MPSGAHPHMRTIKKRPWPVGAAKSGARGHDRRNPPPTSPRSRGREWGQTEIRASTAEVAVNRGSGWQSPKWGRRYGKTACGLPARRVSAGDTEGFRDDLGQHDHGRPAEHRGGDEELEAHHRLFQVVLRSKVIDRGEFSGLPHDPYNGLRPGVIEAGALERLRRRESVDRSDHGPILVPDPFRVNPETPSFCKLIYQRLPPPNRLEMPSNRRSPPATPAAMVPAVRRNEPSPPPLENGPEPTYCAAGGGDHAAGAPGRNEAGCAAGTPAPACCWRVAIWSCAACSAWSDMIACCTST